MPGLRILLAIVALASCGMDVVSGADPIDAMSVPVRHVAAYRPLVGTWSGTMHLESLGLVSGVVSIGASGSGTFFVAVAGASESGTVEILEFADGQVRARALGRERSVPIIVGENQLALQISGVGELLLKRSNEERGNVAD